MKPYEIIYSNSNEANEIASTPPTRLKVIHTTPDDPKLPQGTLSISELVSNWAKDDSRKNALEDARRWIADEFYKDDGETLRSIRLRKGLSQTAVAKTIGSSQPHIARIESGTENITIDTCRRLADCLEIDLNTLDRALRRQQEIHDAHG